MLREEIIRILTNNYILINKLEGYIVSESDIKLFKSKYSTLTDIQLKAMVLLKTY